MYNEDKKLISDIKRRRNTEENLKTYADHLMKAEYEYACQKFALNYFTIKEMVDDKNMADDTYIYECIMAVNKLVGKYIVRDEKETASEDMLLIGTLRDRIIAKMKVLTAYTDAFELYEYILNRKEFEYPENKNERLEQEWKDFDASQFADRIFRYVFADNDNVVINTKLQSLIGQLPLRMTKNKFYDIMGQTLSIYKGCETGSVMDFVRTLETTALIELPEGFDTEYKALYDAYNMLKEADIAAADYEEYARLSTILDKSAGFINSVVSDYMLLIEIVDDLYAMMIANPARPYLSETCKTAQNIIDMLYRYVLTDDEIPDRMYELLVDTEGAQEDAGAYKMMLEAELYEVTQDCNDEITGCGYQKLYLDLDRLAKLLSGSLFVDIDHISVYDSSICDAEHIIDFKDRLIKEFGEIFAASNKYYNRAVMAKTLSGMPVFFNSQQEIKDYLANSLNHCSNESELKACYMVISDMMAEAVEKNDY